VNVSDEGVRAWWCRIPSRPNFGDALTPWMIRQLTGRPAQFASLSDPRPRYLITGSIVATADARCTVWGAGIMTAGDMIDPAATFLAVRGPLTRARALACGADCPEVLGDPGLLLATLRPPTGQARAGVGIAPHFSDRPLLRQQWSASTEVRVIDLQQPVELVADALASCELVITSSLHAMVACHSYGVPVVWGQFRPLPSGDGSKFFDHLLAVGLEPRPPVPLRYDSVDVDALAGCATGSVQLDLDALWQSCPLRAAP
jgi:pyruvyltransferase